MTNVTGQCLTSIGVNFWGGNVRRFLTVATDEDGRLELLMDPKETDEPVLVGYSSRTISDNKWHEVFIIFLFCFDLFSVRPSDFAV